MHMLCSPLLKFVVDEGVNLAALADSGAVAVPMPLARTVRQNNARRLACIDYVLKLQVGNAALGNNVRRESVAVGDIGRLDAGHRCGLNHIGRMPKRTAHDSFLHPICGKDRAFLDADRLGRKRYFQLTYAISIRSSVLRSSHAAHFRIASVLVGSSALSTSNTLTIISRSSSSRSIASWCQVSH